MKRPLDEVTTDISSYFNNNKDASTQSTKSEYDKYIVYVNGNLRPSKELKAANKTIAQGIYKDLSNFGIKLFNLNESEFLNYQRSLEGAFNEINQGINFSGDPHDKLMAIADKKYGPSPPDMVVKIELSPEQQAMADDNSWLKYQGPSGAIVTTIGTLRSTGDPTLIKTADKIESTLIKTGDIGGAVATNIGIIGSGIFNGTHDFFSKFFWEYGPKAVFLVGGIIVLIVYKEIKPLIT